MNDSQIIDWIENCVFGIDAPVAGGIVMHWFGADGRQRVTQGESLRDCVRQSAGVTTTTEEEGHDE